MTADGTMIVSPEALSRLKDGLFRYRTHTNKILSEVAGDISRRLRRLEAVAEDAQREVRRRQRELSDLDRDDDSEQARSDLYAAEERQKRVDHWIGQVADALPQFKRLNQDAQELVRSSLPRAVSFIDEKLARYIAYANVQMPSSETRHVRSNVLGHAQSYLQASSESTEPTKLLSSPLPQGFQWVRLESISSADNLRLEDKFQKVSEAEVRTGFSLLKNEILPAIESDQTLSSEYFAELDRKMDRAYAQGSQRVYDAFFGTDCVTLDQGRGGGIHGVTNGRHRIAVAKSLGWVAVPAKVI